MDNQEAIFFIVFPFLFIGMWLLITTILSGLAGWRGLVERYPDRLEPPLVKLGGQSGVVGMVNYNGCLNLAACRSGLRVSVWKLFGLFDKPFLAPWSDIQAIPKSGFLGARTELVFGSPPVGRLVLASQTWARLSAAIPDRPSGLEGGPVPSNGALASRLVLEWAVISVAVTAFFSLGPRLLAPGSPPVDFGIAIGFPILVGVSQIARYLNLRTRKS